MSAPLVNTIEHRKARNLASIAYADRLPEAASVRLFSAQGGTLRAIRYLAKPCGTVGATHGRITLIGGSLDDIVASNGGVSWGEWCDGAGVAISGGRVTDLGGNFTDDGGYLVADPEGVGSWVIGGTSGTQIYYGGLVLLVASLIG